MLHLVKTYLGDLSLHTLIMLDIWDVTINKYLFPVLALCSSSVINCLVFISMCDKYPTN